jgi:hypothetical protein
MEAAINDGKFLRPSLAEQYFGNLREFSCQFRYITMDDTTFEHLLANIARCSRLEKLDLLDASRPGEQLPNGRISQRAVEHCQRVYRNLYVLPNLRHVNFGGRDLAIDSTILMDLLIHCPRLQTILQGLYYTRSVSAHDFVEMLRLRPNLICLPVAMDCSNLPSKEEVGRAGRAYEHTLQLSSVRNARLTADFITTVFPSVTRCVPQIWASVDPLNVKQVKGVNRRMRGIRYARNKAS